MANVLIVDDHPINRQFLVKLVGYVGHQAFEAADGIEALATARVLHPGVVITDIVMPRMDGTTLVREMRQIPSLKDTPVIFYTASYRVPDAKHMAQNLGVRHTLHKPAKPPEILRALEDVLGAGARPLEAGRISTERMALDAESLRLAAFTELTLDLASALEPVQLLTRFAHASRYIIDATAVGVAIDDGQGRAHHHVQLTTNGTDSKLRTGPGLRLDELSRLLGQNRSLRLTAPEIDPTVFGFSSESQPLRSLLMASLPLSGESSGLMWLYITDKRTAEEFTREDERLGITLAAQLVIAYENARLHTEARQRAETLEREVGERCRAEAELRHAQASLTGLVTSAMDGIISIDEDQRIMLFNPAAERLFRCAAAEAQGQPIERFIPERFRAAHAEHVRNFGRAGVTHRRMTALGEVWGLRADGTEFPVEASISQMEVAGRKQFSVILRDISVRKHAEEVLLLQTRLTNLSADVAIALTRVDTLRAMLQRCAESLFRHLEAAFARIWTVSESGDVLELQASAGMYTHLDGPHSRVPVGKYKIGRIAQEKMPHLSNHVVHDPLVSDPEWAAREGLVAFAGYPLLVGDRLVGVAALFARHQLSAQTLEAIGGVANQIALGIERKRTEDDLLAIQRRLQYVVASSPAMLFTLAVEGDDLRPTWISENVCDLLGYTVAEALQPSWWHECIHPEDRPRALAEVRQVFAQGRAADEYRFRHRDGSYRWVRSELRLPTSGAGQGTEVIGSWSDITERKNLEDQFRQAQKMEAVGQLAGGVAHDFNNLLTIINGYGEIVLGRLPGNDPARDFIREVVAAGNRAAGLTRQLLAFSRKTILAPTVLNLKEVVTGVDKMLRRIIGEDIQLTVAADPEVGMVKADAGQIEQVLLNLVVNARDAMPQGGRLTIEVRNAELDETYTRSHAEARPGPHVLVAVSDTGCGMGPDTMARVFEPFFSTKGKRGTGLGLATVYGIVKQSSGHVAVYSEVGLGTTFKVYLPRVELRPTESKSSHGQAGMPRGSETILLVEDEPGVRALARHLLQESGYTVLEAVDGAEAVRLAGSYRERIALVVTDVVMPRLGGQALAERLAELHPGLKVLFMSGYTDDAVVRHGILRAEVAFLQKPFTPATLTTKVREVLDQPRAAAGGAGGNS